MFFSGVFFAKIEEVLFLFNSRKSRLLSGFLVAALKKSARFFSGKDCFLRSKDVGVFRKNAAVFVVFLASPYFVVVKRSLKCLTNPRFY